mmetsp:Transcript_21163/g.31415  ORF Transcript_21163/g.31415 Transcript_21163/m.31415 type:complete len:91 (-) Transcript_21163:994-1266(-)
MIRPSTIGSHMRTIVIDCDEIWSLLVVTVKQQIIAARDATALDDMVHDLNEAFTIVGLSDEKMMAERPLEAPSTTITSRPRTSNQLVGYI